MPFKPKIKFPRLQFQSTLFRFSKLSLRRLLLIGIGLFTLPILGIAFLRGFSAVQASGYIYRLDTVPARPVAIVFGAQVFPSGRLSAMLADRVRLAAELYRSGRVRALLLTGDNSEVTYNEPEAMRRYALEQGVPDEAIVLDYAGFSTYDSCYRARDIFGVDAAILVTQDFHLDRALLICNALEIDAVGVAADVMRPTGYARRSLLMSELREFPATALAVFDLARHDLPTYLGEPLPIFDE
jgi:vancomycin permeability regulator SanA